MDADGKLRFTGNRYALSGQTMPAFKAWATEAAAIDWNLTSMPSEELVVDEPILNQDFLNEVKGKVNEVNTEKICRISHSHGHTMQEIYALRQGKLDKAVDCVVYIGSHEEAEFVIKAAVKHNVVLIPYGGGTNVTQALMANPGEKRMTVSVDMQRLNKVKWVDKKNMTACVEAGIMGKDLEKELAKHHVVCGHEPDSVEFSTLGGWISTRASGMKKNVYGNIEDIIINIKIATPIGTITKSSDYPRISSGPDLNEIIMGSEGNYGIITEAIIRIREPADVRTYGSVVFKDWETGCKFMYDVMRTRIWPASIRLVDNTQFQFGQALKGEQHSKLQEYIDKLKKAYVLDFLKFDPQKMVAVTLLFEGSKQSVNLQENNIYNLAKKHGGIKGGAENGLRGYFLTFAIAYFRDLCMNYYFVAESFETSVPWSNVLSLCSGVKDRIEAECKAKGVKQKPFISFRLTQLYETGATIYVYFGFRYDGLKDPVGDYSYIEDAARDEVMKHGGSISHHHGVGKLRKKFITRSIGENGVNMLKSFKEKIDPTNVFGAGNTY